MSFTVFLGNLPAWVTADDIKGWLSAENLVADAIKVIRNPETQESKGFAFIDAPNAEEMNAIIRRFDRAPLEDRLLRANPAQPPKPKGQGPGFGPGPGGRPGSGPISSGFGPSGAATSSVNAASRNSSSVGTSGVGTSGVGTSGVGTSAGAGASGAGTGGAGTSGARPSDADQAGSDSQGIAGDRPPRRARKPAGGMRRQSGPQSAFAEELAKAL
jgi:RNA recognition motif-containing protein